MPAIVIAIASTATTVPAPVAHYCASGMARPDTFIEPWELRLTRRQIAGRTHIEVSHFRMLGMALKFRSTWLSARSDLIN
jgi:hypothetical protein